MSDVPTNESTPTPEPTPEPTPTPTPDPVPEPDKPSLVNEPVEAAFDAETLTLPEGFEKGEHFDQFVEWSKEAGINQSQAEKLVNLYVEASKQQAAALTQYWEEQQTKWQDEVKADKELGGTNLPQVKQTISKLLDNPEMSDPKFREALDLTGAGNHPAIIRSLYRWAQKLSEGASVAGAPPARNGDGRLANQPRSLAEAVYGPEGPHSGGPRLG